VVAGGCGSTLLTKQPGSRPSAFLDDRLAAGYRNRRTGDIARFFRCEHDIDGRELAWLCGSLHGNLLAEMRDGLYGHR
jgi:hypothetical protein